MNYEYFATANKIVDGDTINLTIDLGFRMTMTANCRLSEINAPEINTEAGKQSKQFLETLIKPGQKYFIQSTGLDKYGRPIVKIFVNDMVVNYHMIEMGFAKQY